MDLVLEILNYLDYAILAILVIFSIRGLMKGFKSSIISLIIFCVPILLFIIFSDHIVTLGANIFENQGISFLGDKFAWLSELSPDSNLSKTIINLVNSILEMGVFISIITSCFIFSLLGSVIFFVIKIVLWVISGFHFKASKKDYPEKKRRILGMLISQIHFVILILVTIVPLMGIIKNVEMVMPALEEQEIEIANKEEILKIFEKLESSTIRKIIDSAVINDSTIDKLMVDEYLSIDISKDEKIYIFDEITNILVSLKVVNESVDTTNQTLKFSAENSIKIKEVIENSKIIRFIMPAALEYLCNVELTDNEIPLKNFNNINWDNESLIINDILSDIVDFATENTVNYQELSNVLDNATAINLITSVTSSIGETDVLYKCLIPYLDIKLSELQTDDELMKLLYETLELSTITKEDVKALISDLNEVIVNLQSQNFIKVFFTKTGTLNLSDYSKFEDTIDLIINLNIFDGKTTQLVEGMLDTLGIKDLTDENNQIDLSEVVWEDETSNFAKISYFILNKYNEQLALEAPGELDYMTLITGSEFKELINTLDDSVLIFELASNIIDSQIIKIVNEAGTSIENKEEIIDIIDFSSKTPLEFKNDLSKMLDVITGLVASDILNDSSSFTEDELTSLKQALNSVFDISITEGNEAKIIQIIFGLTNVNSLLDQYNQTIDYTGIDWNTEMNYLIDALVSYLGWDQQDPAAFAQEVSDSVIVRRLMTSMANGIIKDFINQQSSISNKEEIIEILSFTDTSKEQFETDLANITFISENFSKLSTPDETLDEQLVRDLFDKIFTISSVVGNEDKIMTMILEISGIDTMLATIDIEFDFEGVTWSTEQGNIEELFISLIKLGDPATIDLDKLINEDKTKLETILLNMNNCQSINKSLPKLIDTMITSMNASEWKSDWFNLQLTTPESYNKVQWDSEISSLLLVVEQVVDNNIELASINLTNDENLASLEQVLLLIAKTKTIDISKLNDYIESYLTTIEINDVTLGEMPTDTTQKESEISQIFDIIELANDLDYINGNSLQDNSTNLGVMLNKIKGSVVLKPTLIPFIEKLLSASGLKEYVDLTKLINQDDINWKTEMTTLNSVFDDFNNLTGTLTPNISGLKDSIIDITDLAVGGQLATQIIGNMLDEQIDEIFKDNAITYEFDNIHTMENHSVDLVNILDLTTKLQELSPSNKSLDNIPGAIRKLTPTGTRPSFTDQFMYEVMKKVSAPMESDQLINYNTEADKLDELNTLMKKVSDNPLDTDSTTKLAALVTEINNPESNYVLLSFVYNTIKN